MNVIGSPGYTETADGESAGPGVTTAVPSPERQKVVGGQPVSVTVIVSISVVVDPPFAPATQDVPVDRIPIVPVLTCPPDSFVAAVKSYGPVPPVPAIRKPPSTEIAAMLGIMRV